MLPNTSANPSELATWDYALDMSEDLYVKGMTDTIDEYKTSPYHVKDWADIASAHALTYNDDVKEEEKKVLEGVSRHTDCVHRDEMVAARKTVRKRHFKALLGAAQNACGVTADSEYVEHKHHEKAVAMLDVLTRAHATRDLPKGNPSPDAMVLEQIGNLQAPDNDDEAKFTEVDRWIRIEADVRKLCEETKRDVPKEIRAAPLEDKFSACLDTQGMPISREKGGLSYLASTHISAFRASGNDESKVKAMRMLASWGSWSARCFLNDQGLLSGESQLYSTTLQPIDWLRIFYYDPKKELAYGGLFNFTQMSCLASIFAGHRDKIFALPGQVRGPLALENIKFQAKRNFNGSFIMENAAKTRQVTTMCGTTNIVASYLSSIVREWLLRIPEFYEGYLGGSHPTDMYARMNYKPQEMPFQSPHERTNPNIAREIRHSTRGRGAQGPLTKLLHRKRSLRGHRIRPTVTDFTAATELFNWDAAKDIVRALELHCATGRPGEEWLRTVFGSFKTYIYWSASPFTIRYRGATKMVSNTRRGLLMGAPGTKELLHIASWSCSRTGNESADQCRLILGDDVFSACKTNFFEKIALYGLRSNENKGAFGPFFPLQDRVAVLSKPSDESLAVVTSRLPPPKVFSLRGKVTLGMSASYRGRVGDMIEESTDWDHDGQKVILLPSFLARAIRWASGRGIRRGDVPENERHPSNAPIGQSWTLFAREVGSVSYFPKTPPSEIREASNHMDFSRPSMFGGDKPVYDTKYDAAWVYNSMHPEIIKLASLSVPISIISVPPGHDLRKHGYLPLKEAIMKIKEYSQMIEFNSMAFDQQERLKELAKDQVLKYVTADPKYFVPWVSSRCVVKACQEGPSHYIPTPYSVHFHQIGVKKFSPSTPLLKEELPSYIAQPGASKRGRPHDMSSCSDTSESRSSKRNRN